MIKRYFSKGKWRIYDVSQEYEAFNVFEIKGYSEILGEESEIFEMLEVCLKQFKEEGNEIMVK